MQVTASSEARVQGWCDESSVVDGRDATYLLGTVLVAPTDQDGVREGLRALRVSGQAKVHWYDESRRRRDRIVTALARLPVCPVVVARHGSTTEPDERRRRKCFEVLAPLLAASGCRSLTLESRGAHLDRRDRALVDALRARRITSGLRVDHVPGPEDPLLWAADIVCGVVGAELRGDPRYLDALGPTLSVIHVRG